MEHKYKVLYTTEKGLMAYVDNLVVFVNNRKVHNCKVGVALIDEASLVDKGSFGFADFTNVDTVLPDWYGEIEHFANTGVPVKSEIGHYGDSIFIKETYINQREVIKAYLSNGDLALQEFKIKANKAKVNPFYSRLNDSIKSWEDITENVKAKVAKSIVDKQCNVPLDAVEISTALKGKYIPYACKLPNGLVLVEGKYETLAIWEDNGVVAMTWLGEKFDYDKYACTDITDVILNTL